MMKDFILIIILVVITIGAINLLDHKEPYVFETVNDIVVTENKTTFDLITSDEISGFRWFHDYEIKDKNMYVTTYKVINPMSKAMGPQYKFSIDKGLKDFDKIYLNAESENKLIWNKD